MNDKHNILIVGNGAAASAVAKKMSEYTDTGCIYITGSENYKCDYYEFVDIREDDLTGLLKFVLENNIDLTVPTSELALSSDIVSFFQSNGQNIFGPSEKACRSFINKINCKKFLYKCKAQGTKFAMYSKFAQAQEYISKATFPLIISTQEQSKTQDSKTLCTTILQAEKFLEKIFLNGETDVLIQEYPYGTNFTAYFVTDGYSAVPLTTVRNFYFENSDISGKYTDGIGCYAPEYRADNIVLDKIQSIVQNILENLDRNAESYTGIIGIECVLANNNQFYVQDVKPFLQNHDARAVLNLCDCNLYKIMNSCINGYFSDEYDEIQAKNASCVSVCVKIPEETEIETTEEDFNIDYNNIKIKDNTIYSKGGITLVLTGTSATLTGAKNKVNEELDLLKIDKMTYRKDICDKIKQ